MKLTKILAIVGLVAVILGVLWWFGGNREVEPLRDVTEPAPLTEEYPGLPEGHTFVRESGGEIVERFRSGDGIIFLGFKECPWCQKLAPILNEAAMLEEENIYYYDIRSEREGDTDTYQELVSILEPYLAKDENGESRIYVPDVSFVKGGEIVWRFEMGATGEEERTPDTYWTHERREQAVETFREQIQNLKLN